MSTQPPPDEATHEVSIEGEIHPWHKDTISAAEIRELGELPDDSEVMAVRIADGSETPLAEDEVHDVPALEPGKPLIKKVDFRRAG